MATLNAEIDNFKTQCNRLQQLDQTARKGLTDQLYPALAALRSELKTVENEFSQLAPKQELEVKQRRSEINEQVAVLQDKIRHQTDKYERQKRETTEEKEKIENNYVVSC